MSAPASTLIRLARSPLAWGLALLPGVVVALAQWSDGAGIHAEDFAQYLLHARALAEGRAYTDIGYIWTRFAAFHTPAAMPPGVPAALAAAFLVTGYNLAVAKLLMLAALLAFALCAGCSVARLEGRAAGLAVAALLPLSITVTPWATVVNSDIPLAAAVWGLVLLADRPGRLGWRRAIAIAVLGAFAVATRTLGLVVIPATVAVFIVRRRELGSAAVVPVAVWSLAAVVAVILIAHPQGLLESVLRLFGNAGPDLAGHLRRLRIFAAEIWLHPTGSAADDYWHIVAAGLAVAGLATMVRAWGDRVSLAFGVLYLGVLLALPFGQARYYLPLAPLLLAGVWRGVAFALQPMRSRRPLAIPATVSGLALLLGAGATLQHLAAPPRGRLETMPATRAMFAALQAESARAPQRVVFARPLVLALETGVPAMPAFYATSPATIAELRRRCITLVVTGWPGAPGGALRSLGRTIRWRASLFEPVWSNDVYRLYRFDPGEGCGRPRAGP